MPYGRPMTEEERRRREFEAAYGFEPGYGDVPEWAPPGTLQPQPTRNRAPAPSPEVARMALDVSGPRPGSIQSPPELPKAPPPVDASDPFAGVAAGVAGIGDILSAPLAGWQGRPVSNMSGQIAGQVQQDATARQEREDRNWRSEVQDLLANRRLAIGEQQERRADAEYQGARDPSSPRSQKLQERARQMRDQGILNATDEQIAAITPQSWEDGGWAREAQSERGVQQNKAQADAAQERRMGEESVDAQEQLEMLRAISYPGADQVDANDPQAVARFIQVTEGAMNRDQRERLGRLRARRKSEPGGGPGMFVAPDPYTVTDEVRSASRDQLSKILADPTVETSQRQYARDAMKDLNEFQEGEIPGFRRTKRVSDKRAQQAAEMAEAVREQVAILRTIEANAPKTTEEAARFKAKALGENIGMGSVEGRRYTAFKGATERFVGSVIRAEKMGVPTGTDVPRARDMAGDPASWAKMASGQAAVVVGDAVKEAKAKLADAISDGWEPVEHGDVQGDGGKLAPLTAKDRARLEELRRKRAAAGGR